MATGANSSTEVATRNSAEHERARKDAKRRDQYRCQYCGRNESRYIGRDLHAHHIRPISNGGTHDLENLVTLCNRCHNRLHHRTEDREEYPPELLDDMETVQFTPKVYRSDVDELSGAGTEVVRLLRKNGPMKLEYIVESVEYSRGYINRTLDSLRFANFVCRVRRGVYAYIPEIKYRKMLANGRDEHGNYRVEVRNFGEQSKLTSFAEGVQEDDDARE